MPDIPQWARVHGDMNCHVRRGAWYEVLRLTPDEAVLEVNHHPFGVDRSALQIRAIRPDRWSVVPRPRDAVDLPLSWGSTYGVCPKCGHRESLNGQKTEMPCPQCGGVFMIGWDDQT